MTISNADDYIVLCVETISPHVKDNKGPFKEISVTEKAYTCT